MVDERVNEELTETEPENKASQDNDSFHSFESENDVPDLEKLDEQPDGSFGSAGNETPMKPQKYELDGKARKKLLIDWSSAREEAQEEQNDPKPKSPVLGVNIFITLCCPDGKFEFFFNG